MKKNIIWTSENENRLIELINDGLSSEEICKTFKAGSKQSIYLKIWQLYNENPEYQWLNEKLKINNGVQKRQWNKQTPWTKDEENLFIKLRKNKITFEEISDTYIDRGVEVLKIKAKELGLSNKTKRWTDKEDKMACDMFNNNNSFEEIGKLLNRSGGSVRERLKRLGVVNTKRITNKELEYMKILYLNGRDLDYIAEATNKNKGDIKKRLEEIGVIDENLCLRCKESPAIKKGKYKDFCVDCIDDIIAKEKIEKRIKDNKLKINNRINRYINEHYNELLFCEKCQKNKNPNKDYYYSVSEDKDGGWIGVSVECKKCAKERNIVKRLKNYENRGYN